MQLCKGSFKLTVTNGYAFVLTMCKPCRNLAKNTTETCCKQLLLILQSYLKGSKKAKSVPFGIVTGACRCEQRQPSAKQAFGNSDACMHIATEGVRERG